jgi:hypothetical protein
MLDIPQLRRFYESECKDERAQGLEPKGRQTLGNLKEAMRTGQITGNDFSIRKLMENFIFDDSGRPCGREIIDSWSLMRGTESEGESLVQLMEAGAVQTTAFSYITGQILFNAVLPQFNQEGNVFTNEIPVINTQFSGERIPRIGGIGNEAEIVGEAQIYPQVGLTQDFIDTPVTTKRGMICSLTKEAAFFDRTGQLLEEAGQVGFYLGVNKEIRAIDCVIDENTTVHQYNRKLLGKVSTYNDNTGNHTWDNLQANNALANYTNVDNADQLLYAILDPNTGLPVVIEGNIKIIVPRGLLKQAEVVMHSTSVWNIPGGFATTGTPIINNSPNVVPKAGIMTSRLLITRMGTLTSWYYGSPKQAFRYMQNWPITVVQAPTNSYKEFEQDIVMQWKASERGQFATFEPRYMVKSTA